MDAKPTDVPAPPAAPAPGLLPRTWHSVRGRVLSGLLLVLPIVITLWVVYWLYSTLEYYAIDPLARLVLGLVRSGQPDADLPPWFEKYAAPVLAVVIAVALLYCLGFLARSRVRRAVDWVLLRVPVISVVYNGVWQVLQTLDRQRGQARPQRVVLVPFPHPGTKVPAFVTGSCRDIETGKVILCVYVPTTPVPTSGYYLLVPEEDVTEPSWTPEQTLQAIISGGLTAPPEVRYFGGRVALESKPAAARSAGDGPPGRLADAPPPQTGEAR
jgi:uncharacterized membrane protein